MSYRLGGSARPINQPEGEDMAPYHDDGQARFYLGDCREVMRELDADSIDAIVTDPPYGLGFMGKEWDNFTPGYRADKWPGYEDQPKTTASMHAGKYDLSANGLHRFQEWCEEWAAEALRVAKPGAHLVAFGGPRTYHRLACAIEDAGWEIRDSLMWLFGSGFPKSLDVSKALDKRAEVNVETQERIALVAEVIRSHREAKGMERTEVSLAVVGIPSGACWNWEHHQLPSVEMWPAIKRVLGIPDHFDGLIEGDRAQVIAAEREVTQASARRRLPGDVISFDQRSSTERERRDIPATDLARQWEGWGTALKPGYESIVLARKPLRGTVAANVAEWGTGAINVDGCRIEANGRPLLAGRHGTTPTQHNTYEARSERSNLIGQTDLGRWPANVILDEDAAALVDAMVGERTSGIGAIRHNAPGLFGLGGDGLANTEYGDSGGPSRFYYTAKASRSEREAGLHSTELVTVEWETWDNEVRKAQLRVDTELSPPKVTAGCTPDEAIAWSTLLYGSSTTGPSLVACRCTTATETNSTIGSTTLNSLTRLLTSVGIPVVKSETANGSSPAAAVGRPARSLTITFAQMASPLDASPARSARQLKLSVSAGARKSTHPTVKPLALMRWLCRLVTPPGGLILDPFVGSGTTAIAAKAEGMRCVGIEMEVEYLEIARRRCMQMGMVLSAHE